MSKNHDIEKEQKNGYKNGYKTDNYLTYVFSQYIYPIIYTFNNTF